MSGIYQWGLSGGNPTAIRWAGLAGIVYIPLTERPPQILTGMTNQHHGRGRGRVFAGFRMCSRGLVAGGMPWGFGEVT